MPLGYWPPSPQKRSTYLKNQLKPIMRGTPPTQRTVGLNYTINIKWLSYHHIFQRLTHLNSSVTDNVMMFILCSCSMDLFSGAAKDDLQTAIELSLQESQQAEAEQRELHRFITNRGNCNIFTLSFITHWLLQMYKSSEKYLHVPKVHCCSKWYYYLYSARTH